MCGIKVLKLVDLCFVWLFIMAGAIETVWGLCQVYGYTASNHSLYALTGSFYNPGPYSGFVAMCLPVCLHEWLKRGKSVGGYIALGVLLLMLCVLPAGMSRSAWIAAAVASAYIGWMHYRKPVTAWIRKHKVLTIGAVIAVSFALCGAYLLKKDSADGRLLMWKVSVQAIKEKPLTGYGWDYVAGAYGDAQEKYFSKGDYTAQEERVAGSPEYVFNEYLQAAMAWGVPVLCVILLLVIAAMAGYQLSGNYGLSGAMLSLAVFSFSSYPFQFPLFVAAFGLLVLTGLSGWLRFFPVALLFPVGLCWCAGIYGGYVYFTHVQEREAVKNRWQRVRMFYHSGAYSEAVESYMPFHESMKWNARYLFELGHACHKAGKYDESNKYLKEALKISADPMILNILGKNSQAEKLYIEAEHYLLRSVGRLPGRIYPYYLLFKLYDEMPEGKYAKGRKEWAARMVLEKEPKVQSTAIHEMREEVSKRMKKNEVGN